MNFSVGELWYADGPPARQAVVVDVQAEGRRGLLFFQDTFHTEWFSSLRIAKEAKWRVGQIKDKRPLAKKSLRGLLLNIIYAHPVCPDNYLLNVIAGKSPGDWSIEHGPPNDEPAYTDCVIPPYYDSLVAKLIVYGQDRPEALARLGRALDTFVVEGIHTSIPLHQRIRADEAFRIGDFDTGYIARFLGK